MDMAKTRKNNYKKPKNGLQYTGRTTFGLADQFEGLNVASRPSRSPLSHGLHVDLEDPRVEPPALVLKEAWSGC